MRFEQRIRELGILLPEVVVQRDGYVPAVRHGQICWSAGQLPFRDDQLAFVGRVGRDLTLEEGQEAAELALLNALGAIRDELGSLDDIIRVVRLGGYVNSDDSFENQHKVMNGASEMLHRIFGEAGRHARTSVGINILPFNAAVEVELIVAVT